mmetsp:Transcript_57371/g.129994  ORF Transcript_57371/g.129994 Transcript_57371/m.129994 type:complete len:521 (+) Transcript_57371:137-1699(+)
MRDLLQLGLDVPFALRHLHRLPPQLLQRGNCILALIGPFKAIVLHDHAYFFSMERSTVRTAVHRLMGQLKLRHLKYEVGAKLRSSGRYLERAVDRSVRAGPKEGAEKAQVEALPARPWGDDPASTVPGARGVRGSDGEASPGLALVDRSSRVTDPAGPTRGEGAAPGSEDLAEPPFELPFELVVVESLLDELCGVYQRRMRLLQPVVSRLLLELNHGTETAAMEGLHRLVPIKTGISNFQMVLDESVECLELLLNESDEDLVALLLSEKRKMEASGKELDPKLHTEVEMLVEAYHRRLVLVKHQVNFLQQRVKSTQEIAAIRMDVSRNRIIRTNLQLTIASVSLGVMTACAGFLGMNLELPRWIDGGFTQDGPNPGTGAFFLGAVGASCGLGGAFYGFGLAHASGRMDALTHAAAVDEIVALARVFEDMGSIEHVVHQQMIAATKGRVKGAGASLSKAEFAQLLGKESMREVSEKEVDIIFEIFDISKDGRIEEGEVDMAIAQEARKLGSRAEWPSGLRK